MTASHGNGYVIRVDAHDQHGTALLMPDDSIWVTLCPRWWDIVTRFWWWCCPSDKKAWMILTNEDKTKVRTRAIRVAKRCVRLGPRGEMY